VTVRLSIRSGLAAVVAVAALSLGVSCSSAPAPGKALADEYYNLGNAWFDLKKYDQAARAYRIALDWNPELKIASLNLARTRAELGDNAGALEVIGPLADSDPDNLVVAQYRAWLTGRLHGLAAAADLYASLALRLPGDAATQFNAGVSLAAAGRDSEALTALQTWKGLDGKGAEGLAALAALFDKTGSTDGAAAWLDAALAFPESDARRFAPLAARAQDLEAAELYGDAVAAWDAALALPPAADQNRGEAQFRRGSLLLLRIEDYDSGLKGVLEAWKAGYRDPAAWKRLTDSPDLKTSARLEADLKLAGVAL
jgi:tetratricopeptide (TPR) repeat protein